MGVNARRLKFEINTRHMRAADAALSAVVNANHSDARRPQQKGPNESIKAAQRIKWDDKEALDAGRLRLMHTSDALVALLFSHYKETLGSADLTTVRAPPLGVQSDYKTSNATHIKEDLDHCPQPLFADGRV